MTHIARIVVRLNEAYTRGTTSFDLMLKTGARTVPKKTIITLANHKELLK
jgi:hypothetical protein